MKNLKNELIKLGYKKPELRDHIRPVLARLEKTAIPNMSSSEALKRDRKDGFYAEWDDEYQGYCVFGLNTGFCYETAYDLREAEEKAEEMNRKYVN